MKSGSLGAYHRIKELSDGRVLLKTESTGQILAGRPIDVTTVTKDDLQRNIAKLCSLDHPNILKVHQCMQESLGKLMIVEDYCEQRILGKHLSQEYLRTRKIMQDVATGLHYLHTELKAVHCALEPQNIRLKDGRALIGGITLLMGNDEPFVRESARCYQAPEIQYGHYGYPSDIWALGVLFLQLIVKINLEDYLKTTSSPEIFGLFIKLTSNIEDSTLRSLIGKMLSLEAKNRPTIADVLDELGLSVAKQVKEDGISSIIKKVWMYRYAKLSENKLARLERQNFELIKSQAERGNPEAMYLMGRKYGIEKNYDLSKQWCLKAVEKGDSTSYHNLWMMENDEPLSVQYLKKGYALGDLLCRWKIGRCYGFGDFGFEKDLQKGLQILRDLPVDYGSSKVGLAGFVAQSMGLDDPYEPHSEVIDIYIEGANLGSWGATQNLSVFFYRDDDFKKGLKYAMIAMGMRETNDKGDYQMPFVSGSCYIVLRDRLSARRWHYRRIRSGNRLATDDIGEYDLF